jgi:3-hydroxymyristoyl/3-hydroxydecanoyl-(acyl carrier protein) dehydratase
MTGNRTVCFNADHPALAGHFPGYPVVPAVLILYEVMEVMRESCVRDMEFLGMSAAKFLSPLRPGEPLTVELAPQGESFVNFTCTVGSRVIATGCLEYRTKDVNES